jgi:hypothetical protein
MCDVWVGEGSENGSDDCDVEHGGDGACCPMGSVHLIGEPRDLADHARLA